MTENEPVPPLDKILAVGDKAKKLWELGAFIIAVGAAIGAFVTKVGGPVQFLVEVAFIGFAAYVAIFFVIIPVSLLAAGLERLTGRETTESAKVIGVAVTAVLGAALVRFGLFAPGITEDNDAFGTVFAATVGVGILLLPVFMLWYKSGSRPRAK